MTLFQKNLRCLSYLELGNSNYFSNKKIRDHLKTLYEVRSSLCCMAQMFLLSYKKIVLFALVLDWISCTLVQYFLHVRNYFGPISGLFHNNIHPSFSALAMMLAGTERLRVLSLAAFSLSLFYIYRFFISISLFSFFFFLFCLTSFIYFHFFNSVFFLLKVLALVFLKKCLYYFLNVVFVRYNFLCMTNISWEDLSPFKFDKFRKQYNLFFFLVCVGLKIDFRSNTIYTKLGSLSIMRVSDVV